MDFSTRGTQPSPAAPRPGTSFGGNGVGDQPKSDKKRGRITGGKWSKWGNLVMLVVVAVLLLAIVGLFLTNKDNSESSLVDTSKLQAVFLTNDQVYFGDITTLNGKTLVLQNVYYLQTQSGNSTSTTTTDNNVSLVKLGCELHKPYDTMVINRGEVQFWENLQGDGQVANAVKQFQQQNPNGQKCSNTTGSSTGVQGTTGTTNETTAPKQ
jgi:hypothetical protein